MARCVSKQPIEREHGYLYKVGRDGFVWKVPTKVNRRGEKQKIGKEKIERKTGFMYYLDKAGYVVEAKMKGA